MSNFGEYVDMFFSASGFESELDTLVDLATTHHTFFFRESPHFELLQDEVVPELLARGKRSIQVWSGACSSGEECYSLAMVLNELAAGGQFSFAVRGSDISLRVLDAARRGVYAADSVHSVPAHLVSKYFLRSKDRSRRLVRIAPELRSLVSFSRQNLREPFQILPPPDIIWLRNVIIYFDAAGVRALLQRICSQLPKGGYLFLSLTETIGGNDDLPLKSLGRSVYRRT